MLINIFCAKCIGIQAVRVTVEVDISSGIGIHLVGLADTAVRESLLRIMTSLQSIGYRIPGKKIVINLAPADMRKSGSGYDLPIALGIIAASGQHSLPLLDKYMIMGELGLDGSVRPVPGAIPIAEYARNERFAGCILPEASAMEAAEIPGISIYGVRYLSDVIRILSGDDDVRELLASEMRLSGKMSSGSERTDAFEEASDDMGRHAAAERVPPDATEQGRDVMDFSEIVGQDGAKRGLEIAACGGHNVIMIGSPGSGKTSLAKAMIGIMPPMLTEEAIVTSKIYSVSGIGASGYGLMRRRPFRAPHYSASMAAIIGGGGGDNILPGEVSLAQNGILFLDEFAEMPKPVTEALRGPLEDRKVTISRLRAKVEFPASFMLVAAANPCPCGYYGEKNRCTCSPGQRQAYLSKLSGPIMDRIDVHLFMHPVSPTDLVSGKKGETSADVAARVKAAREIQKSRFAGTGVTVNSGMSGEMLKAFCPLSNESKALLEKLVTNMGLSARAFTRILKLSRSIADLETVRKGTDVDISTEHILEAAGYRFLDRIL